MNGITINHTNHLRVRQPTPSLAATADNSQADDHRFRLNFLLQ